MQEKAKEAGLRPALRRLRCYIEQLLLLCFSAVATCSPQIPVAIPSNWDTNRSAGRRPASYLPVTFPLPLALC